MASPDTLNRKVIQNVGVATGANTVTLTLTCTTVPAARALFQRLDAAVKSGELTTLLGQEGAEVAANSFQAAVGGWMAKCFGEAISADTIERNHRFLEEALELVQACGCTRPDAISLVDYVFGRPVGDKPQEVGGVMVTLAALCMAQQIDMDKAAQAELIRCWAKMDQIRAKQAAKPHGSPLPGPAVLS